MKDKNIKIIKKANSSADANGSKLENSELEPQLHQAKSPPQKGWLISILLKEEDHIIHIIFLLSVIVLGSCSHH